MMNALNVIWQTSPGAATSFELEYIQKVLLAKAECEFHFDCEAFSTVVDHSLVIYSTDLPDISESFRRYLEQFDALGYTYSLLHLSNEKLNHNCNYYKKAYRVFRGYYDPSIGLENTIFIPLGFKSGFHNSSRIIPDWSERPYIWAFIGQIKPGRQRMHDSLIAIRPNFTHLTHGWNCPTSLSPAQVIDVYKKTLFAPCPSGWSNVDAGSFRILEALEWGCVPIVQYGAENDLYRIIYGDHPFEVVQAWEDAPKLIRNFINEPSMLKMKMDLVRHWYVGFKDSLATAFSRLNNYRYHPSSRESSQSPRGIRVRPR